MFRELIYAWRGLRRAPFAAVTVIATVGLGLALVGVVFSFYSAFFLRADAVQNPDELFEVRRAPAPGRTGVWVPLTRIHYEELRRDTDSFTDMFAMLPGISARVGGRTVSGTLVTDNFFQVLGVTAAEGRPLTPADGQRAAGHPLVVLSHRGAIKLFPGESRVVGRHLSLNGASFDVVGIMPADFRGLAVTAPDFWSPLNLLDRFRPALSGKEGDVGLEVAGRLKPNVSPEAAASALTGWASANADMKAVNGRPKTMYLRPKQGTAPGDVLEGLRLFAPLFFAFGLILLIACANVANLLLARGVARQREIGVRLSLGASRLRVVRQLLTESLLLALAAAICGYIILRLLLVAGASAAVVLVPEIAEHIAQANAATDWRAGIFLLLAALISIAFFGLVPALQTTSIDPLRAVRGDQAREGRPSRARNFLIGVQVCASAALLISAAVFLRGAFAAARVEPGVRVADTLLVEIANESSRMALLQTLADDPTVTALAASWPHRLGGELAEATGAVTAPVEYKFVSPEYFDVLDIGLARGRAFRADERSAKAAVAIISESTARRLWLDGDPLGQRLYVDPGRRSRAVRVDSKRDVPEAPSGAFTVVGVVRDVRIGQGRFEMVDAGVYLPIDARIPGTSLILRAHGDPEAARLKLTSRLVEVDPAMGSVTTLRAMARIAVNVLQIAFAVTALLAALALMLTLSGLYSVLSYLVAQRSKEIGVRMALGASTRNVAALVLLDSVRPVLLGLCVGSLFAGAVAGVLMTTRTAADIGEMIDVFDPLAYAVSLACVVGACAFAALIPSVRASRINPIETLRQV